MHPAAPLGTALLAFVGLIAATTNGNYGDAVFLFIAMVCLLVIGIFTDMDADRSQAGEG